MSINLIFTTGHNFSHHFKCNEQIININIRCSIARRIFDFFVLEAAAHIWCQSDLVPLPQFSISYARTFPIWLALFWIWSIDKNINLFANFIQLHNNLLNVFPFWHMPNEKIQQMSNVSASFVIQWWWGNYLPFKIYPWRWCGELKKSPSVQDSHWNGIETLSISLC